MCLRKERWILQHLQIDSFEREEHLLFSAVTERVAGEDSPAGGQNRRLRQQIFEIEDEIAEKRDTLIDALEKRMHQRTAVVPLFTIRWRVV